MASTEHKDPTHRAHLWERVTPSTEAPSDGFDARILHNADHETRTVTSQSALDASLASGWSFTPTSLVMIKGSERWLVHTKAEKDQALANGWTVEEAPSTDDTPKGKRK